jgi:hypothetical protein
MKNNISKCAMCGYAPRGGPKPTYGFWQVVCYKCGQSGPIRARRRDAGRIWNTQQSLITQAKEAKKNPDYSL